MITKREWKLIYAEYRADMNKLILIIGFVLGLSFISSSPSWASSCPMWLKNDLKRAQKISGHATQRYKISGNFGGSDLSVIGTARKKGPRCVVNILGYTLRLNRSGSCVKFAFVFSGNNHRATWCRNKGYVVSKGIRNSATVRRLPVSRDGDVF